jgi:hypothetical protein
MGRGAYLIEGKRPSIGRRLVRLVERLAGFGVRG